MNTPEQNPSAAPPSVEWQILEVEFQRGVVSSDLLPGISFPEIAFLGRSNVGKSSFINQVCGRKQLARTSAKPGKTQELNFYLLTLNEVRHNLNKSKQSKTKQSKVGLVDFPGFGYAQFSKEKREHLAIISVNYLQQRENLKTICLLQDIRREPGDDELAIRKLALSRDAQFILVITKSDKIKRSQIKSNLKRLTEQYGIDPAQIFTNHEQPVREFWGMAL